VIRCELRLDGRGEAGGLSPHTLRHGGGFGGCGTADAVTDEKKGSYCPAILTLSQKDMDIDGKRVPLSPGMNITAEIKTGKRRVIEYLLSPVQRAGSESLRER